MTKIFKAYDIRGIYGDQPGQLDEKIAYLIGRGAAEHLFTNNDDIVLVSHDARVSSDSLYASLIQGLRDAGRNVLSLGLASTPMNYWANQNYKVSGSIQVTASHNSKEYNGFKISGKNATPISYTTGIDKLDKYAQDNTNIELPKAQTEGTLDSIDNAQALSEYIEWQSQFVSSNNDKKLKIAIDCANGMAGHFIEDFCKQYNWIEPVKLYWDLDGNFPNHEADPQKAVNLQDVQKATVEHKCDFGVGFDGDGDRAVFIDNTGEIIPSDLATGLIGVNYLQQNPDKDLKIGYDLRSSKVVPEYIEKYNGTAVKTKVGHSHIKKQMRQENLFFSGELSGHFYFQDCFCTDSALMALIQVINIMQYTDEPLSQLISEYRKYFHSSEINYKLSNTTITIEEIFANICSRYKHCKQENLDGLTIEDNQWWFNLRTSNTEPLLRLNAEGETPELLQKKVQEISDFIQSITK